MEVEEDPNEEEEEEGDTDPNEEEDWGPVYPDVAERIGEPPSVFEDEKDCWAPV